MRRNRVLRGGRSATIELDRHILDNRTLKVRRRVGRLETNVGQTLATRGELNLHGRQARRLGTEGRDQNLRAVLIRDRISADAGRTRRLRRDRVFDVLNRVVVERRVNRRADRHGFGQRDRRRVRLDLRDRHAATLNRVLKREAPIRENEVRTIRGQIDATVRHLIERRRTERAITTVARCRSQGQDELYAILDRRIYARIDESLAGGQILTNVNQRRDDLRFAKGRAARRVLTRRRRNRRAPQDLIVLKHEVHVLDEIITIRRQTTKRNLSHAAIGEIVERILPRVEVVLNRDRRAALRSKRKRHRTRLTIDGGRNDLRAVDLHRHVSRIGGGDTTIRPVHDGTLENVEHLIASRVRTRRETEGRVQRTVADQDVPVSGQFEDRHAEVVDRRARHEARARRRAIDERRNLRRRPTADRRSRDRDREGRGVVDGEDEFVIGTRHHVVVLADRAVEHASVRRDLIAQGVRDERVRAVEVIRHPHVVRRRRLHAQAKDATRTVDIEHDNGNAIHRDGDRRRIRRRRARAVAGNDGIVTDLNAVQRAVKSTERDLSRRADTYNSATCFVLLHNALVNRRGRTAHDLQRRLRQDFGARTNDQRQTSRRTRTLIRGLEIGLRVNARRGVNTIRESHSGTPSRSGASR